MKKILLGSFFTFAFLLFPFFCEAQFGTFKLDSLSSGMTSHGAYVLALAMKDSTPTSSLYAGGSFKMAGRKAVLNVAEWQGVTPNGVWIPLGSGINNDVCALAMYENNLYAGGKFDTAGGIASSHIARWDTVAHKWDSLVGKLNGNVYALCVYNNNLYVGGDFTIADGDTVNRIAVWKDSVWASVGKGFDTGAVYALTVSNDTLYAGGSFLKSNGLVVNHIAKLKGNNWDSLKGGTNNTVYAMADCPAGFLYVGGAFTKSDGIITQYLSYFDDYIHYTWNSFGGGMNDTVRAINTVNYCWNCYSNLKKPNTGQVTDVGNVMFVGGNFDSAFGRSCNYIFCMDGLIGEVNGPVYAITHPYPYSFSNNGDNYIGGEFNVAKYLNDSLIVDTVNNVSYFGFSEWEGIKNISDKSDIVVYPNPNNGQFTLQIRNEELGIRNNIEVYNMLGEKVLTETLRYAQGDNSIDLTGQPNGIYLYRVITETGSLIGQGKLIIQK